MPYLPHANIASLFCTDGQSNLFFFGYYSSCFRHFVKNVKSHLKIWHFYAYQCQPFHFFTYVLGQVGMQVGMSKSVCTIHCVVVRWYSSSAPSLSDNGDHKRMAAYLLTGLEFALNHAVSMAIALNLKSLRLNAGTENWKNSA